MDISSGWETESPKPDDLHREEQTSPYRAPCTSPPSFSASIDLVFDLGLGVRCE